MPAGKKLFVHPGRISLDGLFRAELPVFGAAQSAPRITGRSHALPGRDDRRDYRP